MYLDEAGFSMLAEGVPKVRRESVLSIAQAARRTGSVVVVVGPENLQILCEVRPQNPVGLRWYVDGAEVPASRISHLLDVAQQGE
ncbi:hypothetical protein AWB69_05981 [Caballeronia udeis]|uniref:Uncharacterized protein n=1 Tax=Caballeronia udeis TaxID=1232866 RepID=A0A158IGH0_9BURK|nr:hypothetical protein [Caballeronia udeis]SAL55655.1 hypothetical protein AWB69_05981 [Caballeronia udeis]